MAFLVAIALPAVAMESPEGLLRARLANGLEVTILADPTHPIVATQLWVHAGSAEEGKGERGLAHLFEHLMFGGTERFPRGEYERFVHRWGGYENAFTSPDETVYVSEIPPEGHARVLEMEADRFASLPLTEENLANEKRIVLEELRLRTENDPVSRALVAAQRRLLGDHPYAHDPSGTKEEIAAATLESARGFHERWYRPEGAHLVVVGPVDPAATLETVREVFGPIPGGEEPGGAEVPALLDWPFPERIEIEEDIPPAEIAVVGFPLPPADSPDTPAIRVMLRLLAFGATDPFRDELVIRRKKALEAGIETLAARRGGAIAFWSASLPYRRKATAWRLLDESLDALSRLDWLDDASLAAAKRAERRDLLRGRWYAEARADAIGRARWWEGDALRAFDAAERIEAVTREDVARVFNTYVVEGNRVRMYVKPERVPILVRLFGWLYPVFR